MSVAGAVAAVFSTDTATVEGSFDAVAGVGSAEAGLVVDIDIVMI